MDERPYEYVNDSTCSFTTCTRILINMWIKWGLLPFTVYATVHTWSEDICFHWHEDDGSFANKCLVVHAEAANASAVSAGIAAEVCGSKTGLFANDPCCQNDACFRGMISNIQDKILWGRKVHSPVKSLEKQRSSGDVFLAAAEELLVAAGHLTIVQIGAHVGAIGNDPIYSLVATNPFVSAAVVEPLPLQFGELRHNYRREVAAGRVEPVHAAICDYDGTGTIWTSTPPAGEILVGTGAKGPMFDYLYRGHHSQMSSMDVGGVYRLKNRTELETEAEMRRVHVTCLTPGSLLQGLSPQFDQISALIIDAEGSDLVALVGFLGEFGPDGARRHTMPPRIVIFEHLHLSGNDREYAVRLLDHWGYVCQPYGAGMDIMCLRASPNRWAGWKQGPEKPTESGLPSAAAVLLLRDECPTCCHSFRDCTEWLASATLPVLEVTIVTLDDGHERTLQAPPGGMHPSNSGLMLCLRHSVLDGCDEVASRFRHQWLQALQHAHFQHQRLQAL